MRVYLYIVVFSLQQCFPFFFFGVSYKCMWSHLRTLDWVAYTANTLLLLWWSLGSTSLVCFIRSTSTGIPFFFFFFLPHFAKLWILFFFLSKTPSFFESLSFFYFLFSAFKVKLFKEQCFAFSSTAVRSFFFLRI